LPCFSLTINTPADGPFSLYTLLSTGVAPTGTTLGGVITPILTGKPCAYLGIQSDPANTGGYLYIGDSTLLDTGANQGTRISPGGSLTVNPGRGVNSWMNYLYFNTDTSGSVVNFIVLYG
jgi:hypothetical protein